MNRNIVLLLSCVLTGLACDPGTRVLTGGGAGGAAGSNVSGGAGAGAGGSDGASDAAAGDARAAGSGGRAGSADAGAAPGAREIFSTCRFHFGTIDSRAKSAGAATIAQLDYFTPGWMLGASFDHQGVCNDTNPNGVLANKVVRP